MHNCTYFSLNLKSCYEKNKNIKKEVGPMETGVVSCSKKKQEVKNLLALPF